MIALGIKYTKAIVNNNIPKTTHLTFSNKNDFCFRFCMAKCNQYLHYEKKPPGFI